MSKDETSKQDGAAKRRKKLQALREKQKQRVAEPRILSGLDMGSSAADSTGPNRVQGNELGSRRARLLKFLAERRAQSQEGSNVGGSTATRRRRQLLAALTNAGDDTRGGAAALERFPRLRELLAPGRSEGKGIGKVRSRVNASSSPEEISRYREDLETRADRLDRALKRTLAELDEVRKLEAGRTPTLAGTEPEQPADQARHDSESPDKASSRE